jgi:hypothetical protein
MTAEPTVAAYGLREVCRALPGWISTSASSSGQPLRGDGRPSPGQRPIGGPLSESRSGLQRPSGKVGRYFTRAL